MWSELELSVVVLGVVHWVGGSYGTAAAAALCTYDEVAVAARNIKACNPHLGAISTAILQHREGMTYRTMCR